MYIYIYIYIYIIYIYIYTRIHIYIYIYMIVRSLEAPASSWARPGPPAAWAARCRAQANDNNNNDDNNNSIIVIDNTCNSDSNSNDNDNDRRDGRPGGGDVCSHLAVPFIPVPMPKPVCRTCLNKKWVQFEVCITFLGRGRGTNITARSQLAARLDRGLNGKRLRGLGRAGPSDRPAR